MQDIWICLGCAAVTLAAGLLGMWTQRLLPEAHMSGGASDMIRSVTRLLALLLSLALGTLVGSAYQFFAAQKANVELLSNHVMLVDNALAEFGADAVWARAGLYDYTVQTYRDIWVSDNDPRTYSLRPLIAKYREFDNAFANLTAKTPLQTNALAQIGANLGILEQTRLLMGLQVGSTVSWPLLFMLVSWATMLFFCYGVMAKLNATSVIAAFFGVAAVSSAIFLILSLNKPYTGLFRIPDWPIQQVLAAIGK